MTSTEHIQPIQGRSLPAALVVALLSLATAGCSEDKSVRMKYCATVAALHTADRKAELRLVTLMEKFTSAHGLRRAGVKFADTNEYKDGTTALDLSFGVGGFGSLVTLFYPGSSGDDVKAELNSYLVQQVNPVFKVRQCSDIPGFKDSGASRRE